MQRIDLQALADNARLGRFHRNMLLMCTAIIICDGYDLAVVGIALPAIMESMAIGPEYAGMIVSTALFGMMFGSVAFGSIAGWLGRRWSIALCMLLFSAFTALAGLADDPVEFGLARFVAGIGIGGVMPNVIAQMSEYAPRRVRSMLVALMFSGYSLGGVLAALVGKGMIEWLGWSSVFLLAALPILLVPLIFRSMPDSMPFLIKRGRNGDLRRLSRQLDPDLVVAPDAHYYLPRAHAPTTSWRESWKGLFDDGRARGTVMFWLACFICLFMVYAISSWLAKLLTGAGLSLGSALSFVAVLNVGAMIGAASGGWLADRIGSKPVLMGMCGLAAVSIIGLGYLDASVGSWRLVLVAIAGASTIGTQIVLTAYASQFYPAVVRSLGLGVMLGVGRMGAILAPILIGYLMAMHLPLQHNFLAIGLPALVAVVAVGLIRERASAHSDEFADRTTDRIDERHAVAAVDASPQ